MVKYYIKKGFAISLILISVYILVLSEGFLIHRYVIERIVASGVLFTFGIYYLMVIEGRMEKHGRC